MNGQHNHFEMKKEKRLAFLGFLQEEEEEEEEEV